MEDEKKGSNTKKVVSAVVVASLIAAGVVSCSQSNKTSNADDADATSKVETGETAEAEDNETQKDNVDGTLEPSDGQSTETDSNEEVGPKVTEPAVEEAPEESFNSFASAKARQSKSYVNVQSQLNLATAQNLSVSTLAAEQTPQETQTNSQSSNEASKTYTFTEKVHEPTCENQGYTEHICNEDSSRNYNDNFVAALGHTWDEGAVTTEPTYEAEGVRTFTCLTCGKTKTESIPKLEYTWKENVVAPTCSEQGYTEHICVENESKNYKDNFVAPVDHDWDDGEVVTPAEYYKNGLMVFHCKFDGCTETKQKIIPATGYTWAVNIIQPTCTEQGYTEHLCQEDDSLNYKEDYVDALGHSYEDRVTDATCTAEGKIVRVCKACGNIKSIKSIPMIAHQYDCVVTKEATFTEEGLKTYTCKSCGHSYTETIPVIQVVETSKQVVAATCESEGYTLHTFNDGHTTKTDIVAALGHSYGSNHLCSRCGKADPDSEVVKNDPWYHYDKDTYNKQVAEDTNKARTDAGLSAMTYATQYQAMADLRAQEQLALWGHTRPDGSSCFTVLSQYGVSYKSARENVAWIPSSYDADDFITVWMNSSGHKANILGTDNQYYVVGTAYGEMNGVKGVYGVQIFWSGWGSNSISALSLDAEDVSESAETTVLSAATENVETAYVDDTEASLSDTIEALPETVKITDESTTNTLPTSAGADETVEVQAEVTPADVVDDTASETVEDTEENVPDVFEDESSTDEDSMTDSTVEETEKTEGKDSSEVEGSETVDDVEKSDEDAEAEADAPIINQEDIVLPTVQEPDETGSMEVSVADIDVYEVEPVVEQIEVAEAPVEEVVETPQEAPTETVETESATDETVETPAETPADSVSSEDAAAE